MTFDEWWNNPPDGPSPRSPVSKETAQWIWECAQRETLRTDTELAAALGWPLGIHSPETGRKELLAYAAEMRNHINAVTEWTREGEQLLSPGESASVLFALGAWWADRPWRKRKK